MSHILNMPKLSPTMEEGTIVKWHKKEGDLVKPGDLLFEVATDKATVEYEAVDGGYLRKIFVPENSQSMVNEKVALFTETKDEKVEEEKPSKKSKEKETSKKGEEEKKKPEESKTGSIFKPDFVPEPPLEESIKKTFGRGRFQRILASPLAKKIAEQKGVDLSTVKGSGPSGRILKKDVESAPKTPAFQTKKEPKESFAPGSFEEIPLTPIRKSISDRLQQAKMFIPHYYIEQIVDAEPLVSVKKQFEELGIKLSFNDFVIKALSLALEEYPLANSGFNSKSDTIIQFKTIDISVAVSLEGGLITPIIRKANEKTIFEISKESKELYSLAKRQKLSKEQYRGGSCTVSNLGMTGITSFKAILNPPQAAILAVGAILDTPVVKKGSVVPGKTMHLCLSLDHRVLDGASGAAFMKCIQKYLENPISLAF